MSECSGWSTVSHGFSTLSLLSWVCAQMPQIFTNYKNKSADGISPSFLALWFLGDFLSFTSCLLNDVVLKFQVYLSLFFICNDIALCFQYYYYNSVYPARHASIYAPVALLEQPTMGDSPSIHGDSNSIHIRHNASDSNAVFQHSSSHSSPLNSYESTGSNLLQKTVVAAGLVAKGTPMPLYEKRDTPGEQLGLFLAWCCTAVYIASRCPQLWKNYKRKSVDGINSVLFGAALVGNLTYTFSILTSCEFVYGDSKTSFFVRELPYILGSSGTCIFDMLYFYQRHIYRDAGTSTTQMPMERWDIESENSSLM